MSSFANSRSNLSSAHSTRHQSESEPATTTFRLPTEQQESPFRFKPHISASTNNVEEDLNNNTNTNNRLSQTNPNHRSIEDLQPRFPNPSIFLPKRNNNDPNDSNARSQDSNSGSGIVVTNIPNSPPPESSTSSVFSSQHSFLNIPSSVSSSSTFSTNQLDPTTTTDQIVSGQQAHENSPTQQHQDREQEQDHLNGQINLLAEKIQVEGSRENQSLQTSHLTTTNTSSAQPEMALTTTLSRHREQQHQHSSPPQSPHSLFPRPQSSTSHHRHPHNTNHSHHSSHPLLPSNSAHSAHSSTSAASERSNISLMSTVSSLTPSQSISQRGIYNPPPNPPPPAGNSGSRGLGGERGGSSSRAGSKFKSDSGSGFPEEEEHYTNAYSRSGPRLDDRGLGSHGVFDGSNHHHHHHHHHQGQEEEDEGESRGERLSSGYSNSLPRRGPFGSSNLDLNNFSPNPNHNTFTSGNSNGSDIFRPPPAPSSSTSSILSSTWSTSSSLESNESDKEGLITGAGKPEDVRSLSYSEEIEGLEYSIRREKEAVRRENENGARGGGGIGNEGYSDSQALVGRKGKGREGSGAVGPITPPSLKKVLPGLRTDDDDDDHYGGGEVVPHKKEKKETKDWARKVSEESYESRNRNRNDKEENEELTISSSSSHNKARLISSTSLTPNSSNSIKRQQQQQLRFDDNSNGVTPAGSPSTYKSRNNTSIPPPGSDSSNRSSKRRDKRDVEGKESGNDNKGKEKEKEKGKGKVGSHNPNPKSFASEKAMTMSWGWDRLSQSFASQPSTAGIVHQHVQDLGSEPNAPIVKEEGFPGKNEREVGISIEEKEEQKLGAKDVGSYEKPLKGTKTRGDGQIPLHQGFYSLLATSGSYSSIIYITLFSVVFLLTIWWLWSNIFILPIVSSSTASTSSPTVSFAYHDPKQTTTIRPQLQFVTQTVTVTQQIAATTTAPPPVATETVFETIIHSVPQYTPTLKPNSAGTNASDPFVRIDPALQSFPLFASDSFHLWALGMIAFIISLSSFGIKAVMRSPVFITFEILTMLKSWVFGIGRVVKDPSGRNLGRQAKEYGQAMEYGHEANFAGRFEEAASWYRCAVTLAGAQPKSVKSTASGLGQQQSVGEIQRLVQAHLAQAEATFRMGNYKTAELVFTAALQQLLEKGPNNASIKSESGAASRSKLSNHDLRLDVLIGLGQVRHRMGNYSNAIECLHQAQRIMEKYEGEEAWGDTRWSVLYEWLGKGYYRYGNRDKGREYLEMAIKVNKSNYTALAFLGEQLSLSPSRNNKTPVKLPQTYLRKAITLRSDYPGALIRLSLISKSLAKDPEMALEWIEMAKEAMVSPNAFFDEDLNTGWKEWEMMRKWSEEMELKDEGTVIQGGVKREARVKEESF